MQVQLERTSDTRVDLQVRVAAEEIGRIHGDVVRRIRAKARIPGFRPGKAPIPFLLKRFGEAIEAEAIEQILSKAVPDAIAEASVRPVSTPSVRDLPEGLDPKADYCFVVECEVLPTIEPKDYTGVDVSDAPVEVPDEEIEKRLEAVRKKHAEAIAIDDRPARDGDKLAIRYHGTAGSEVISADDPVSREVVLGPETLLPEFHEALVGASTGEVREVRFTFGDDDPNESLRGEQAHFHVTVDAIHEIELPDLDDDVAQSEGFDSLAALRDKIVAEVREGLEEEARRARVDEALDLVVERNPFEVPESLAHEHAQAMQQRTVQMMMMYGIPEEQVRQTLADDHEAAIERARKQIKIEHLLRAIADKEGLGIDDDALEEGMRAEAARLGAPLPRIKARYGTDEEKLEQLRATLLRERTIRLILGEPEPAAAAAAEPPHTDDAPEDPAREEEE